MYIKRINRVTLTGTDEGTSLSIMNDNRGEPYREGLSFELSDNYGTVSVLLDKYELLKFRDAINNALESSTIK
jgi:hypothetical protein